jgi:predicted nucleic acid-binding protein
MKRILFDTNIVLDVLLDRAPHVAASSTLWAAVEAGIVEGMLAAHAVTTIHYLIRKQHGEAKAKRTISSILTVFRVAAIDGPVLSEALHSHFPDFEDAVTASAAQAAVCDWIVTRDARGFKNSLVRAVTPEMLAPLLREK